MSVRRLCVALAAAALLMFPDAAHANGLNLSWDACGAAGVANKQFACDTNTGYDYLVLSAEFAPRSLFTTAVPVIADLEFAAATSTLPSWWQLSGPSACRAGALTSQPDAPYGYGSCDRLDTGLAHFTWATTSLAPERRRLTVTTQPGVGLELLDDTPREFIVCVLRISHASSCGGCTTPVCIVFNSLQVLRDMPPHPLHVYVTSPFERNFVTWRGGAGGMASCPAATPVHNSTWGSLKSLYR